MVAFFLCFSVLEEHAPRRSLALPFDTRNEFGCSSIFPKRYTMCVSRSFAHFESVEGVWLLRRSSHTWCLRDDLPTTCTHAVVHAPACRLLLSRGVLAPAFSR